MIGFFNLVKNPAKQKILQTREQFFDVELNLNIVLSFLSKHNKDKTNKPMIFKHYIQSPIA